MATEEEIKVFEAEFGLPANPNGSNPNAPEFLKFFKQKNNAGCMCSNCKEPEPQQCYTVVSHSTRAVPDVSITDPCQPSCAKQVKTGCGDC